jgi:3-oxoadipate enol-lactonase
VFIQQTILNTSAEVVCRTLQALADRKETCSYLPKIKIPTLIIVGKEDKVTPPQVAQKIVEAIAGSELAVMENAGHLSNLEAPDEFNSTILKFLERVD